MAATPAKETFRATAGDFLAAAAARWARVRGRFAGSGLGAHGLTAHAVVAAVVVARLELAAVVLARLD